MTAEELMKTAELAVLLRKTPAAISMMRHRGKGPRGFRAGREVLYPVAEVEAWLAAKVANDPLAQRATSS
ncbi:helix-turn-helix transcriptional regulator [Streptomyces sp. adm13(2018)]|uniref:helix-turn-helix transcriptional regulator n=1 Tax=Streptomyces sp. adm13(2018) TaxID=2479007 RepID=UPI0011CE0964|nr:helix-turn-helix domain-containing protein [Streptomyces sp. adm13(2018)]